ncbi:hypothetical protein SAMN04488101_101493 [Pedobacter nyackensis]|uniref:Uncharacterized protein n=2 Tax=Pedobacter nyackensis TaxID=475255 RepID=A0A1W2ADE2_9SPHI|nr:hypothetical protein SAMN04488101_101493 [Pedobacter nyackensis]
MLFSLIILSYFGIADSTAQQINNNEDIEATVFGLLNLKHNYEELMSKKRTNSANERKTLTASELNKSEYGRSVKMIKDNAPKYLAYIEKAMSKDAETLSKQYIIYQKIPVWDSGARDRYVISKLDYLKGVKYSLFEQKSDELLHLYKIPGIKLKYPIPTSSAIRPVKLK